MKRYRQNLSGDAAFRSFIPLPLSSVSVDITPETEIILKETRDALEILNEASSLLSEEEIEKLIMKEARYSFELASAKALGPCAFDIFSDCEPDQEDSEDIINLKEATKYAVESMDVLPLSSRLLKNIHYMVCSSSAYDKKYRGELRSSPIWIGSGKSNLKNARYVPPVGEDMTTALSELENYINYGNDLDILIRAALIHYQYEMIHPFIDANGRTGRLLNTLFLIENKVVNSPVLLLSGILKKQCTAYYAELQYVHENGIYDDWIKFFLKSLREAAVMSIEEINRLRS